MLFLIIALIFGALGAVISGNKGRNQIIWFILCFLFPLISLIILALLPNLSERQELAQLAGTKKCPACAERIKKEANVCRFCSYQFNSTIETDCSTPRLLDDKSDSTETKT